MRPRPPIVQNTRFCKACALATNWMAETSALHRKTTAMPNSTTPLVRMPLQRAMASSSSAVAAANAKAHAAMAQSGGIHGASPAPSTMATDAPSAAAEDTPRVSGLARGLFRMVCISAPARPRARPTRTAARA